MGCAVRQRTGQPNAGSSTPRIVGGVRLAGIEVSDSAAAELACRLQEHGEQALALHIGHAIDHLHDRVRLTARDREALLRVLSECPPRLQDLRATLLADEIGSVRANH